MKIEGSVALVTGGAMGIGRMMVETLLDKGAKLVSILDYDEAAGGALATELKAKHSEDKVKFIKCDVSSKQQLQDAFTTTQSVHNRLDIVCNNAGIEERDDPDRLIQINLLGSINGTDLAKDIMMKQTDPVGGVIVNTASLGGLYPAFYSPYYSASKHGVVGYTRSVASHPVIQKANIRLNLICPSFVEGTSMVARARQGSPILQMVASKANYVPMSDVTKAFLMAIEDDALNGRAIRVSPGLGVDLHPHETPEDLAKLAVMKSQ